MKKINENVTSYLSNAPVYVFAMYSTVAAFMTYFCMYGFRKPFTAAKFEGLSLSFSFGDLDLKIALVISQLIGYALSKCMGVKFVSEMKPQYRAWGLICMIAWAQAALVLFAVLENQWLKIFALFLNGIPLGMVWGLVFSFLEGRKTSELLGAGLSCSYIIASGAVKTIGAWWMTAQQVDQFWMPAVVGFCFFPVFLFFTWALARIPAPNAEDVSERTERKTMNKQERKAFLGMFFPGLFLLTFLYFFLTAYRGFRDDFAAEIWTALGYGGQPSIFTKAELPIPFVVMLALALLYKVKDNRLGLYVVHGIMLAGTILIGVSTIMYDLKLISGIFWMILVGLGLYLAYVPYGCVLFDRLIAAFGVTATAVFMIYLTDAVGYIGTIAVNLYKNFSHENTSMLNFFRYFSYVTSIICSICFIGSWWYFKSFKKKQP